MNISVNYAKEIALIVEKKGFKPKTVTTQWIHKYLIGEGKEAFINMMCFYLYYCEIQSWLRSNKTQILIYPSQQKTGYEWIINNNKDIYSTVLYESYEEALEDCLLEILR